MAVMGVRRFKLDIVVVGKAAHHATHALVAGDLGLAAQALGDVGSGVSRQHTVIGGKFVGEPGALVEQGDLFGVVDRGVNGHGSSLRSGSPREGETPAREGDGEHGAGGLWQH